MKSHYPWTNLLMIILACFALITLGLHIYANWNISLPLLTTPTKASHSDVLKFVIKTIWISSIPIFLFFMLTAIAGFWRQRFYLPLFFIFFFWLGGWHEFQEISIAWNDFSSFGAPFTLVAWSSILMLLIAIAAMMSWIVEYSLRKH